ncbi:MAG: hypothetical protein PHT02_07160 [Tissierellia bacterium]|nr:hypothetical protein [Tissierellia bacterium]
MKDYRLTSNSIGVGGSLIMVIFVMLCLTVFSVLSFTTAYSDLKLSVNSEEMTVDFYEINGKGEKKLAEINEKLLSINKTDLKDNNFKKVIIEKLKDIKDIVITEELEHVIVYYESIGEKNQKICITLKILIHEKNYRLYYEIISWNLTNIEIPEYDEETYDLWEGVDENFEN